ncbi:putative nuclease harbi1, partial [Phtheirospermum japonicum]
GCLGALDGTYVPVQVRLREKPRYRNRRGEVSVNVLGVCDLHMKFNFVLMGWEGSAANSCVLRDAITRNNGLKVPTGNYYLCDCGYTNGPGFLAPYRGVRYHLDEWSAGRDGPQNYKELFNLRHARAWNAIERSFGILKKHWAILRTPAFYNIETQNKMIMACCLVHNFIRESMAVDPMDHLVDEHDLQFTSSEVVPEDPNRLSTRPCMWNEYSAGAGGGGRVRGVSC